MTSCLRIREIEKDGDIVNRFGQKTELRSTRFGVKFLAKSRQKVMISSKESRFPRASEVAQQKSSLQRLNGMGKFFESSFCIYQLF